MTDPAEALVVGRGAGGGGVDPALRRIRFAAGLLALALHGGLLWGWIHVSRWQPERAAQRIEVIFVERAEPVEQAVPAMPVPPTRPIRRVASPRPDPPGTRRMQAVEVARDAPPPEPPAPPLRLWRKDGGLALPEQALSVPVFDDRARVTFDRQVALPGSTDAAYAETVALRLRRAFAPEDVVLAVLQFLMGRPQPDDCGKIEARLQASDPDVSREIDLDKFHRFCK